ncbi:MAG: Two component sensor kinase/response regulator hybrid [Rhizobium sp.]|nr:Two component sensor kinase/response regulator hybrid [Rhizobium sp.]
MNDFAFLASDSESAGLISSFDWASTSLGPVGGWPQSLRTTIALILQSPIAIVTLWGEDGVMIYNDAYAAFAGNRHPHLLGSNVREGWPEVAEFNDHVMRTGLAGDTLSFANQMLRLDRKGAMEDVWLDLDYSPVIGEAGKPVGVIAIIVDITDRVLAERQVKTQQERLSSMFQKTPGFMAVVAGPDHVFEMANDAYLRLIGNRDIVGKPLFEALPEIRGQGFGEMLDGVLASGQPFFGRGAKVALRRQGQSIEERYVDFVCQPIQDGFGRVSGVFMQGNDVTEAKRVEIARQREAHILSVLNRLGAEVAAELDQARVVQMVTDAGVELTGAQFGAFFYNVINERGESYMLYALSGVKREAFEKFPMPRPTAIFQTTFRGESVLRSDDILVDFRYGHSEPYRGMPPGHLPVRSYLAVPVISRSGEVLGGLFFGHAEPGIFQPEHETLVVGAAGHAAIAMDNARLFEAVERELVQRRAAEEALQRVNTDLELRVSAEIAGRMKMEEELRQSQKMEALGQLTGGVAHDFNNLLQVISGNLQLLAKDVGDDERKRRRIDNALAGVERGSKLASQLLAFGRRQPLDPKVVNIGRFVAEMEDMLRRTIGEAIQVETIGIDEALNVLVDPTQVQNALLNLAINARDAMGERGKLTIKAGRAHLDESYVRQHKDVTVGHYAVLTVADTGSGMTPDVLAQVFEPFFSTKPVGKGTGLGLSMVYGFVKQSGGHINIASEPGRGTAVHIYFPLVDQKEDSVAVIGGGAVTGGSETVLVAEDDDEVRATVIELLTDLGYKVLIACHATQALALIQAGTAIDLLFTDVVMPGPLSSTELAQRIHMSHPEIAVLYTSGYAENAIVHGGRIDPGVSLLLKPYARETLAHKVRDALDGRPPSARPDRVEEPSLDTPFAGQVILLVEDEALIRMVTSGMLEELGHRVVEAGNAEEALVAFSKENFDVVITDLGLPGMSGEELARRFKGLNPSMPIVFATGHANPPEGTADLAAYMLRKPYDLTEIERAISWAISGQHAA